MTDEDAGKILDHNARIADRLLDVSTLAVLARADRARWTIENGHIQTAKPGGFRPERNLEHGKRHLSSFRASMDIRAFLVRTAFAFVDDRYRTLRFRQGFRAAFFQGFATLPARVLFDNRDPARTVMFAKLRIETGRFPAASSPPFPPTLEPSARHLRLPEVDAVDPVRSPTAIELCIGHLDLYCNEPAVRETVAPRTLPFFLNCGSWACLPALMSEKNRFQALAKWATGCARASRWMELSHGHPFSSSHCGSVHFNALNCFFGAIALGFPPAAYCLFRSSGAQFQTLRAVPQARLRVSAPSSFFR